MARKFRTKEWAVMMFIANDNDLDRFARPKIHEIESVGSTLAADVILQFDTLGRSSIRRMRLSRGREFRLRALQSETNTGDKRTLIKFCDLTLEDFHPRRSMLVMCNHGSGLGIAGDVTRRPIFWSTLEQRKQKILAFDGGDTKPDLAPDALDNQELKAALMAVARKHRPIDLLVLDACLMGSFEVAYQLRHAVRVIVASQSNIPAPGCIFAPVFEVMRNEQLPTGDIAKSLVEKGTPALVGDEYSALAALDLERADTVAEAVSMLAGALKKVLDGGDAAVFEAISLSHLLALTFLDSETIDLFDFCRRLAETVDDADVCEAAADVMDAVEQFVIHRNPRGAVVDGARGVSITLPRKKDVSEEYRSFDFAHETAWVDFLDTYLPRRFPDIALGI